MNCKSFRDPLHHSNRVHHALETKELQHKYLCSPNENWIASVTCVCIVCQFTVWEVLYQRTWWKEQSQRSWSAWGIPKMKSYMPVSRISVFFLVLSGKLVLPTNIWKFILCVQGIGNVFIIQINKNARFVWAPFDFWWNTIDNVVV